ncbi:MAG: 4Fe-4S binding protein, partial [Bacillota bacterium]|nr:4Fe-4S binding protein [Bacillota bacterium]
EGCFTCFEHCVENAIKKGENGKAYIDYDLCIHCGLCAQCKPIKIQSTCYRILVGGKLGRRPKFGLVLGDFPTYQDVLNKLEQILLIYKRYGNSGERLGEMIERISIKEFTKMIM